MDNLTIKKDYFLHQGYIYITNKPNNVYAVIGSCVVVCLWDKITHLAGLCHYKYPQAEQDTKNTPQYGNAAIPHLIKLMLEHGSKKIHIEAMLFGGADQHYKTKTGNQNVSIAKKILKKHKIKIVSEDIGGIKGRKIIYHTATNQAVIYKVNNVRAADWYPYEENEEK